MSTRCNLLSFLIALLTAVHLLKVTCCLQCLTDAGKTSAWDFFGDCKVGSGAPSLVKRLDEKKRSTASVALGCWVTFPSGTTPLDIHECAEGLSDRGTVEASSTIFDCADVAVCGSLGVMTALEFLQHPFFVDGSQEHLL